MFFGKSKKIAPINREESIAQLFVDRGMLGNLADYQRAVINTMAAIESTNMIPEANLSAALKHLNHLLTHTVISVEHDAPVYKPNVDLDSEIIQEMKNKLGDTSISPLQRNMLNASILVYNQMNDCRQEFGLIYHQPRHAAEMFMDMTILSKTASSSKNMCLLESLCGLFHDAIFKRHRIFDETESAEALENFLSPLLDQLPDEEEKAIIKNLIYILVVGGTTPTFFTKNAAGVNYPTIESIFDVSSDALCQGNLKISSNPNYCIIKKSAKKLADADIQRTSIIPVLLEHNFLYESDAWDTLSQFYPTEEKIADPLLFVSLQRKLTQGLRMTFEGILMPPADPLTPQNPLFELGQYAKTIQAYPHHTAHFILTSEQIAVFAKKFKDNNPFSEINFAGRMDNSSQLPERRDYLFRNTWLRHAHVLDSIYTYLARETPDLDEAETSIVLQEKTRVILSLACVAENQDGKTFSAEKMLTACNDLHALLADENREELHTKACKSP